METTLNVLGMVCDHCVAEIKKALLTLPGVQAVEVSLADRQAKITGEVSIPQAVETLTELGYAATVKVG